MSLTKIYWENPLKKRFTVNVIRCSKKENHYELVMEGESVRPEGGGQAGDKGTIVCNTVEGSFSNVLLRDEHVTLISDIEIEEGCEIELDMSWRMGMMKNHTAEHLFVSSLLHINPESNLGYIWIDGNRGTIEILGESVNFSQIVQTERKVQEIIELNLPVESRLVDSLDLDVKIRAREGVTKHEAFRIVSVMGFDHSACSGTHVLQTGDIGMFKVIDYKITKEGVRLEFATSGKAIEQTSLMYNMALERKHEYPFEMIQLGPVLDKSKKLLEERQDLLLELANILSEGISIDVINEVSFRSHYLPGFSSQELRNTMKRMVHAEQSVTLLFSPGLKSNFVVWTTGLDKTAMTVIKDIVIRLEGQGGGSGNSFTGGFSNTDSPREIYESLIGDIKSWLSS